MAEEPTQIVQRLLEAAPPGEIKDIETDLRKIEEDKFVDAVVEAGFKNYNQEQMISVDHAGQQVLISEHGHMDGNVYLDPRGNQALTVNHAQQSVVSAEPTDQCASGANPALMASIDTALQEYVRNAYPSAASAVYPSMHICISSGLFAPAKFWNGRWTSVWQYQGGKLSGTVKVRVHYYEKGNVHKNIVFNAPERAVEEDGAAIVAAIAEAELAFHRQTTEEAAAIKESFKSLRRALPVTKRQIDWTKIQSEARIGKELGGIMQQS